MYLGKELTVIFINMTEGNFYMYMLICTFVCAGFRIYLEMLLTIWVGPCIKLWCVR